MGAEPLRHAMAAAFDPFHSAAAEPRRRGLSVVAHKDDPFLLRWTQFFSLIFLLFGAFGSGVYAWASVRGDLQHLKTAIYELQTPLSIKVIALEGIVEEIGKKQVDVLSRLGIIDRSGTQAGNSARQLSNRNIEVLTAELAGMNTRCADFNRRLDDLQRKVIEIDVMQRNILELLNPHAPIRGKK